MLRRSYEVQPGQKYLSLSPSQIRPAVWEVVRLYRHNPGILHAALARNGQLSEVKTLSCSVLTDGTHFRLLEEQS